MRSQRHKFRFCGVHTTFVRDIPVEQQMTCMHLLVKYRRVIAEEYAPILQSHFLSKQRRLHTPYYFQFFVISFFVFNLLAQFIDDIGHL